MHDDQLQTTMLAFLEGWSDGMWFVWYDICILYIYYRINEYVFYLKYQYMDLFCMYMLVQSKYILHKMNTDIYID